MKAFATYILVAVLACGTPGVLAQQCDAASPEEAFQPLNAPPEIPALQRPDQMLYKGVVGNLLEAVPMDPEQRVGLQRGNAVISAPMSARSLALLLGIPNPVVMIGGLLWGLFAASRIEAPAQQAKAPARTMQARVEAPAEAVAVAVAGD